MLFLELFIRIAGITLLLTMAAAIVRDAWDMRPARFGFLLAISLSAVLATSASASETLPPEWARMVLSPLGSSSAIFIWWYSLSLFDDDFRLGPAHWTVAAIWTALGLVNVADFVALRPIDHGWAVFFRSVMALAIVGHIVYAALAGKNTDLVEGRRRARTLYAGAIAALFLVDLFSERLYGYYYTPLIFNIVQLSAFLAVIVWSFFWLFRLEKSVLAFEKPSRVEIRAPALTAKEAALNKKLAAVMEGEQAYLEPDLSIGALAERIGAPEHQLRALINKAMGHRNFRSFLNGYRMADAKVALADPEKAGLPILTIAMDAGFASLASFNRAFKQATGETPSDFRKAALAPDPAAQN